MDIWRPKSRLPIEIQRAHVDLMALIIIGDGSGECKEDRET